MTAVFAVTHQDLFEKHPVALDHTRFRKVLLKEMFQNLGFCVGGRGVVVSYHVIYLGTY